jgi:hypothetical protein
MLNNNFPERMFHYEQKINYGYCMMMVKDESVIMWQAVVMVHFNTRIPAFT